MPTSARLVALTLVLVLFSVFVPAAHAGRLDYLDKQYGFSIRLPSKKWTQTPTQPGEKLEVAKFRLDDNRREQTSLSIYRFSTAEAPTTPGIEGLPEGMELPEGLELPPGLQEPKDATTYLEKMVGRQVRFWELEWKGLPKAKTVKVDEKQVEGKLYTVVAEHPKYHGTWNCVVAAVVAKGTEEYLILFTHERKLKSADAKAFKRAIQSFRFSSDVKVKTKTIAERGEVIADEGEVLLDPEKREKIKADLARVKDWRYIDTPHYIIIYDCDRPLARFIAKRIEYMRKNAYEVVFPPVVPIEECMVVRVCKEMDEYYHYGAPRGSAGYWYSYSDELVFPDLSSGSKPDDTTIGVLHHEGFHQYINYALLKHDPPVWFNEGFAEYFFCVNSKRDGKKLTFEKRHRMRYGTVKTALGSGKLIPISEFIHLSHGQYMQRADLCYAEGWAFATWMKNITKNERYQQIPEIFFHEMQNGYAARAANTEGGGFPGGYGAEDPVVKNAMEKAFEGLDLDKLDKDFKKGLKKKM